MIKVSKDEACKMFLGSSLLSYKNRNFETEKIQILIILNYKEFKYDIYKYLTNQNDIISKSGYYGLGIDDNNNKDRDLIILEQIYVFNINKLYFDKRNKNIVNFEIFGQEIENEKNKKKDKKKDKKNSTPPTYNLSIDFSSSNDAKQFISIFKEVAQAFKNKNKK